MADMRLMAEMRALAALVERLLREMGEVRRRLTAAEQKLTDLSRGGF